MIKKAEVRRQRAEGIPINKFKGFSKDVVFLALCVSKYIFSYKERQRAGGTYAEGILSPAL
ncbi:hypothetical protein B4U84_28770 [Westiellopsis prolifica IICB1]|nr:hypothetical protein B4U84_28770 [Westiellopsis prolifica IICB1]